MDLCKTCSTGPNNTPAGAFSPPIPTNPRSNRVSQGYPAFAMKSLVFYAGSGPRGPGRRGARTAPPRAGRYSTSPQVAPPIQPVEMATADQVKALIRSHADGDDARFYAIAMQVAAQAARSGHGRFAQELRDLVDQMKAHATKAVEPGRLGKLGARCDEFRGAARSGTVPPVRCGPRVHLPNPETACRVMRGRLGLLDTADVRWSEVAKSTTGLSHAEIALACEHAAKNAILEQSKAVRESELIAALDERRSAHA
jgi:hypothetical protein